DLLKGVTVVKSRAVALQTNASGAVERSPQDLVAIPYYAWANRGRGQMMVWLPADPSSARPLPYPTAATAAAITVSSNPHRHNPANINDGEDPASSSDPSAYFDWWPKNGSAEWVQMTFAKPATVSEAQLYWFDDTGHGGVRVPASWRLLYQDGAEWKPVDAAGPYTTSRDRYNGVSFKPVSTGALRLELQAQPNVSIGIQEWKVR
ncbi:MAG: discoidin domain-containing protein, partial [Acidobacteriota bacterium]|nr:discoidin domain-containing protein [Acidobacteriota bacterium]